MSSRHWFLWAAFVCLAPACAQGNPLVTTRGDGGTGTPIERQTCGTEGRQCCLSGPPCATSLSCSAGLCRRDDGCGGDGEMCCSTSSCDRTDLVCNSERRCTSTTSTTCGAAGAACCATGSPCAASLVCQSGTCQSPGSTMCGGTGQSCCSTGAQCQTGSVCRDMRCVADTACGTANAACCPTGPACNGTLACTAGRCQTPTTPACGGRDQACCASGAQCQAGFGCCGMTCTETASDDRNCGMCGMACSAGQRCSAGACRPVEGATPPRDGGVPGPGGSTMPSPRPDAGPTGPGPSPGPGSGPGTTPTPRPDAGSAPRPPVDAGPSPGPGSGPGTMPTPRPDAATPMPRPDAAMPVDASVSDGGMPPPDGAPGDAGPGPTTPSTTCGAENQLCCATGNACASTSLQCTDNRCVRAGSTNPAQCLQRDRACDAANTTGVCCTGLTCDATARTCQSAGGTTGRCSSGADCANGRPCVEGQCQCRRSAETCVNSDSCCSGLECSMGVCRTPIGGMLPHGPPTPCTEAIRQHNACLAGNERVLQICSAGGIENRACPDGQVCGWDSSQSKYLCNVPARLTGTPTAVDPLCRMRPLGQGECTTSSTYYKCTADGTATAVACGSSTACVVEGGVPRCADSRDPFCTDRGDLAGVCEGDTRRYCNSFGRSVTTPCATGEVCTMSSAIPICVPAALQSRCTGRPSRSGGCVDGDPTRYYWCSSGAAVIETCGSGEVCSVTSQDAVGYPGCAPRGSATDLASTMCGPDVARDRWMCNAEETTRYRCSADGTPTTEPCGASGSCLPAAAGTSADAICRPPGSLEAGVAPDPRCASVTLIGSVCSGNTIVYCEGGASYGEEPCSAGSTCRTYPGYADYAECGPTGTDGCGTVALGASYCVDSTQYTCMDGGGLIPTECPSGCDGDMCREGCGGLAPGEGRCGADGKVEYCTLGDQIASYDCDYGQRCENGDCVIVPECTEGENTCYGDTYLGSCAMGRWEWNQCMEGTACRDDACVAIPTCEYEIDCQDYEGATYQVRCNDGVFDEWLYCALGCTRGEGCGTCTPGTRRCTGLQPEVCGDGGYYASGDACTDSCVDGECVLPEVATDCGPEDAGCYEGTWWDCTAGRWVRGGSCCTADEEGCFGDGHQWECVDSRWVDRGLCATDDAGAATTPDCTADDVRCYDDGNYWDCVEGRWFNRGSELCDS